MIQIHSLLLLLLLLLLLETTSSIKTVCSMCRSISIDGHIERISVNATMCKYLTQTDSKSTRTGSDA